ncbi:hypothetical protein N9K36_00385 [Candidatus Pelagibacter bacterium]|nr:hypothetical protein [Candidatus Pelagibacter bacterium]
MKKKTSEFYLFKQKSLSEGDLFILDYVRTKRQLIKMEKQLELMQLKLDSLKSTEPKIVRLFDD